MRHVILTLALLACADPDALPDTCYEKQNDAGEDCCEVCLGERACGDSCVQSSAYCGEPRGCACDAGDECYPFLPDDSE